MSQIDKKAVQAKFRRHDADTGSSDVQVALLTKRIEMLTEHLKSNKKDHSSRYGLIKMVSARRRLLDYLKGRDSERYQKLIKDLSIRR
jgi:small subunit ribosomal protein S15